MHLLKLHMSKLLTWKWTDLQIMFLYPYIFLAWFCFDSDPLALEAARANFPKNSIAIIQSTNFMGKDPERFQQLLCVAYLTVKGTEVHTWNFFIEQEHYVITDALPPEKAQKA